MWLFIGGCVVGALVATVVMCICSVAKDAERFFDD